MEHETHVKKNTVSMPTAIIFAGVIIAGAIIFSNRTDATPTTLPLAVGQGQPTTPNIAPLQVPENELALRPGDHVFGNRNADVLMIEYSDTECPFCKQFHQTMHQVMDQYGKDGRVAWVYRHSPIDQLHPKARKEAEAMECANELGGNDAFWKYADRLFEVTPSNNGLDATQLPVIAST